MTPFVPVVAGAAGNLSAIQGSRMSTELHVMHGNAGDTDDSTEDEILEKKGEQNCCLCPNPISTFLHKTSMVAHK